jgi:hypothetical protein
MPFANPLQITYNAVVKDLEKVNQDNYAGEYYLDDSSTLKFRARIAHTLPVNGTGESHLLRLDADTLVSDVVTRTDSAWVVARTSVAQQSTTDLDYLCDALVALLTSGNIGKLLGRQT